MYDVTAWLTNNYILPDISRSKNNQAVKSGQLMYITVKLFLKNHTQNVVEKLFPDLFWKSQNRAYFWVNSLKFYTACMLSFIVYWVKRYGSVLKLSCRPLACTWFKTLKSKRRSGTSRRASFCAWFLNKSISLFIFY